MAVTTLDAACFQDKKMGYSIDFPRGWEVGPLSSFGINGTGAMSQNAVILVGVDKNYIKNFEPSDGFAKFYARTVMYNMYRAYCNKLGLVDAYSTTFKGYDAIYNMFKCNDEYVGTLYIIKNGYIYTMMSAFKDESSAKVIKASLATYKFTK
jgi:hypothetical protein